MHFYNSVTPFESIFRLYQDFPELSLEDDILAHMNNDVNGYVFSTPEVFLMARGVVKGAAAELLADPWYMFPVEQCNCWLVWAGAGVLQKFWTFEPVELPWMCWGRDNGSLKYYRTRVLKRHDPEKSILAGPLSR